MSRTSTRRNCQRRCGVAVEALETRTLMSAYATSWLANTFGAAGPGGKWVQHNIFAEYVAPDGTVYANTDWDEGGKEAGIYKNGDSIGQLADTHGNRGGYAITGNSSYIFLGMTNGYVRRYNLNGSTSTFSGGTKDGSYLTVTTNTNGPTGLAASATELYVSDSAANQIKVYNTSTMVLNRSFAFTNPGQIARASDGSLWVIQNSASPVVMHVSSTGITLSGQITGLKPGALAFDNSGRLLVGDNGPDLQVKIYTVFGTPTLVDTLGAQGGILSGTKGTVAFDKLNGITGLGVDSAGNIYVASDGLGSSAISWFGTELKSFSPTKTKNWQLDGLVFVDAADADPTSDGQSVFTPRDRFTIDYTKPTGQQWTHVGFTVDPVTYPNDPRLHFSESSVWVRVISGQKFLFMTDMYSSNLAVYRFDSANHGETAIPCGLIVKSPQTWTPPNKPAGYQYIWTDANGDGNMQASEYQVSSDTNDVYDWALWADSNGNVWRTPQQNSGARKEFVMQGLNAIGAPTYNLASPVTFVQPTALANLERLEYYPATDTMWMSGYATSHNVSSDWGQAGDTIIRIDNWSTGNRTANLTIALPYSTSPRNSPKAISVAGSYVFVSYFSAGASNQILVYSATTGANVQTLTAGPEVNSVIGDTDIPYGVRAIKRANGEYVVFQEDDRYNKIVMFQWNSSGSVPTAPSSLAATAASSSQINLTWTDNSSNETRFKIERATDSGFTQNLTQVTTTAANVTSYSNTGLTAGTTYYYRVRSTNASGDSVNSNTASATTQAVGVDVIVDNTDPGVTITGAWTSSTSLSGYYGSNYLHDGNTGKGTKSVRYAPNLSSAVTYNVYIRYTTDGNRANNVPVDIAYAGGSTTVTLNEQVNNGTWVLLGTWAFNTGTTGTVTIRTDGTTQFVVADAVRFTSTGVSTPAAPSGLSATAASSSQINLSWTDNSSNETGFKVERATDSSFTQNLILATTTLANVTSYSDTGLSASTQYYYRVRATRSAGDSANSNTASTTTSSGSLTDNCNNLSLVYSSTNISVNSLVGNPQGLLDSGTFQLTNAGAGQTGSVIYQASGQSFSSFQMQVFFWGNDTIRSRWIVEVSDTAAFTTSTALTLNYSTSVLLSSDPYYSSNVTTSTTIPSNAKYLRIRMSPYNNSAWTQAIGQVQLSST